jgi:hypothetical protein
VNAGILYSSFGWWHFQWWWKWPVWTVCRHHQPWGELLDIWTMANVAERRRFYLRSILNNLSLSSSMWLLCVAKHTHTLYFIFTSRLQEWSLPLCCWMSTWLFQDHLLNLPLPLHLKCHRYHMLCSPVHLSLFLDTCLESSMLAQSKFPSHTTSEH